MVYLDIKIHYMKNNKYIYKHKTACKKKDRRLKSARVMEGLYRLVSFYRIKLQLEFKIENKV